MTAYSRGSRGPRVDSGVAGIRTTLAAARSHQAPAAARRFPVRQRGPGGVQRAVGRQGESRVCPPPRPRPMLAGPPQPGHPAALPLPGLAAPPPCPARPPRASMATAAPPSRAATMGRSPSGRAARPHRHGGRGPCSANVPARDAAQQHRVCGRGWAAGDRSNSGLQRLRLTQRRRAVRRRTLSSPRPISGALGFLKHACARAFRVHLHGRRTEAAPARLCGSSALERWFTLRARGPLAGSDCEGLLTLALPQILKITVGNSASDSD